MLFGLNCVVQLTYVIRTSNFRKKEEEFPATIDMNLIDATVFIVVLLIISIVGVFFGRRNSSKNAHAELLVGSK